MNTFLIYTKDDDSFFKNLSDGSISRIDSEIYIEYEKNKLLDFLLHEITTTLPVKTHSKKTLSIMLVTNMSCNLCCSYCFENDKCRDEKLDINEDAQGVLDYIKYKMKNDDYQFIDITFTGGEPLLNIRFIEEITNRLCSEFSSDELCFSIITNGTLLNKKSLDFFNQHKFGIQISFDGNKEFHDNERRNIAGIGSYDRLQIIIKRIVNNFIDIRLALRVNVTSLNYNSIEELFVDLKNTVEDKSLVVYPSFIAVSDDSDLYIPTTRMIEIMSKIFINIFRFGFRTSTIELSGGYCMFKNNNSITIHSNGDLYNCYCLVGDEKYKVGSVRNKEDQITGSGNLCSQSTCPYMDLCFGGCPYDSFVLEKGMVRNCNYEYLDKINKLIFILEIFYSRKSISTRAMDENFKWAIADVKTVIDDSGIR